eukprot:14756959-Alexandrium_andersonii.AAC.1
MKAGGRIWPVLARYRHDGAAERLHPTGLAEQLRLDIPTAHERPLPMANHGQAASKVPVEFQLPLAERLAGVA